MSARHVALGAMWGYAAGVFTTVALNYLDRLAHNARPKVRS